MLTQFFQQLSGLPTANQQKKKSAPPFAPAIDAIGQPSNPWEQAHYSRQYASPPTQPPTVAFKGALQNTQGVDGVTAIGGDNTTTSVSGVSSQPGQFTKALPADYGINRPLKRPMFFGYHNERAIHCGQHLYISC